MQTARTTLNGLRSIFLGPWVHVRRDLTLGRSGFNVRAAGRRDLSSNSCMSLLVHARGKSQTLGC